MTADIFQTSFPIYAATTAAGRIAPKPAPSRKNRRPPNAAFMRNPKMTTCYGCLDRHEGCHADCERYLQQKEAFEIRKAERERDKKINAFFCDVDRRKKRWYRNHKKRGTK